MEEKRIYKPVIVLDLEKAMRAYSEKKDRNLTKKEFCEIMEITTVTMSNYMEGKTPDILRLILDVKKETGIEFDELVKTK